MATDPVTYTGKDADFQVGSKTHSALGMGDFSLTFDRGTVEQELTGEIGNAYMAGALSVDGSFTATELSDTAIGVILQNMLPTTQYGEVTTNITVSGSAGPRSLSFYFASAQITGFDISLGDANTITEASIDFTVLDTYRITNVKELEDGSTWVYES